MIRIIIVLISTLYLNTLAYARDADFNTHLSYQLKAYGLSYCLSHSTDAYLKNQAKLSINAYKNLAHLDNHTYRIRAFIDYELVQQKSSYKNSNTNAVLMQCMSIYQSKPYHDLIDLQLLKLYPQEHYI